MGEETNKPTFRLEEVIEQINEGMSYEELKAVFSKYEQLGVSLKKIEREEADVAKGKPRIDILLKQPFHEGLIGRGDSIEAATADAISYIKRQKDVKSFNETFKVNNVDKILTGEI